MAYLNEEGILLKLSQFGITTKTALNRLRREQNLPTKYITPRKPFWLEEEVDAWLTRRFEGVVKANATKTKVQRAQRKTRKAAAEGGKTAPASDGTAPAITAFKVN